MAKSGFRQFVWDAPTRLFHWLLVGLFGFSWWSAKTHHMDWHQLSGLTLCGLLVFRILWGLIGSSTARFTQFVRGPRAIWTYVRGRTPHAIGHNPLGGLSVIALLAMLLVEVACGLLAVDIDGIESGPLSYLIDFEQGRLAARIHGIAFNVMLGLIGLHLLAIAYYLLVKRRNLVGAMITGFQTALAQDAHVAVRAAWWRLALALGAAVLLTWWIAKGARL